MTSLLPSHPDLARREPLRSWPPKLRQLAFGGDYFPEQWPRETRVEDVALMREANVTLATVGVFAWAELEHAPGDYHFGWLDDVMDELHDAGGSRLPRDANSGSPCLVLPASPGDPACHRGRCAPRHRRTGVLLPELPDLPGGRGVDRARASHAIRGSILHSPCGMSGTSSGPM